MQTAEPRRQLRLAVATTVFLTCLATLSWGLEGGAASTELITQAATQRLQYAATHQYPQWMGAQLGAPLMYQDLRGRPTANVFPIVSMGRDVGYITANVEQNQSPIIEYSTGPVPGRRAAEAVANAGKDLALTRLVYLNGLEYFAEADDADGRAYLVGLRYGTVQEVAAVGTAGVDEVTCASAPALWRQVITGQVALSQSKVLPGVEPYTWYRGCGPTALSMVLNYWGANGYADLASPVAAFAWTGPEGIAFNPTAPRSLVDDICQAVNVDPRYPIPVSLDFDTGRVPLSRQPGNEIPASGGEWARYGTTQEELTTAIRRVSHAEGYYFDLWWLNGGAGTGSPDSDAYLALKAEIDADRPALLMMRNDRGAGTANEYRTHTAVAYGYDFGTDHVVSIYDTWDTSEHSIVLESRNVGPWYWGFCAPGAIDFAEGPTPNGATTVLPISISVTARNTTNEVQPDVWLDLEIWSPSGHVVETTDAPGQAGALIFGAQGVDFSAGTTRTYTTTTPYSLTTSSTGHAYVEGEYHYRYALWKGGPPNAAGAEMITQVQTARLRILPYWTPHELVARGLAWLGNQQKGDGRWDSGPIPDYREADVGLTGLAVLCYLQHGVDPNTAQPVKNALEWLIAQRKPEGSFYSTEGTETYEGSIALWALSKAYVNGYVAPAGVDLGSLIAKAKDRLVVTQVAAPGQPQDGGWTYDGGQTTPDLSNTQWALFGLQHAYSALGLPKDAVFDRARAFVLACRKDSGAFGYIPTPQSTPTPSTVAAGIWSLVLCDEDSAPPFDASSQAAIDGAFAYMETAWEHDPQPPMKYVPWGNDMQRYYYYVLTLGRAAVWTERETINGEDWYARLVDALQGYQATDGRWAGFLKAEKMNDCYSTALAILALQLRLPEKRNYIHMTVSLPNEFHVYDRSSTPPRHFGRNPDTGEWESEIPGLSEVSLRAGPDLEGKRVFRFAEPPAGDYDIQVEGLVTDDCTLTARGYTGTKLVPKDNAVDYYSVQGNAVTTQMHVRYVHGEMRVTLDPIPQAPAIAAEPAEVNLVAGIQPTVTFAVDVQEIRGECAAAECHFHFSDLTTLDGNYTIPASCLCCDNPEFDLEPSCCETVNVTVELPADMPLGAPCSGTLTVDSADAGSDTVKVVVTRQVIVGEVGLALFSVPFTSADNNLRTLFGAPSLRMADWDDATDSYTLFPDEEPFPVLKPGKGFWKNQDEPGTLPTGTSPDQNAPYTIPLGTVGGDTWVIIGAPFWHNTPWRSVGADPIKVRKNGVTMPLGAAAAAGLVEDYAWGWDRDLGYQIVCDPTLIPTAARSTIDTWQGYWLLVHQDCELIIPPTPAVVTSASAVAKPDADDWKVQLIAGAAGEVDTCNFIGASSREGGFRAYEPPQFVAKGVDLRIVSEGAARPLAVDTPPAADELAWDVEVTCAQPDTPVTVAWPDLSQLPSDYRLFITDEDTGTRRYMRTCASYTFASTASNSTRRFRVVATKRTNAGLVVSSASAVSTGNGATVAFTLSAPASVSVVVRNIAGRTVSTITRDEDRAAGASTVAFNGISDFGTRLPAGRYLVDISAHAEDGQQVSTLTALTMGR